MSGEVIASNSATTSPADVFIVQLAIPSELVVPTQVVPSAAVNFTVPPSITLK